MDAIPLLDDAESRPSFELSELDFDSEARESLLGFLASMFQNSK